MNKKNRRVICVIGATGSGKSNLAIKLAHRLNGAIINIDSRQVYAGLPIITAQPDFEERDGIPHLLYGFLPLSRKTTAGLYSSLAIAAIDLCFRQGLQPILVGGTGLYLDALTNGIAPIPPVSKEISGYWQMRLLRAGPRRLHEELAGVDPEYAAKISCNDPQRITRALEVWLGTGRPLSWWHRQKCAGLRCPVLKLGVRMPLAELTGLLAVRIEKMLSQGAEDEVKTVLYRSSEHGDEHLPGFSSIGFCELAAWLRGEISMQACMEAWQAATRAYAKRQITWFRRDAEIAWLDSSPCTTGDELADAALDKIQETESRRTSLGGLAS
ncbi:MAG: tRNA (adenosine(37)-N6)-dimethylallyltransferase MiaA [Desulfovibrionaceae bacterium]|nr:tRNA (adenosine(37)-N6)-dimethylallyltransferase MiaA [Desulfovibrionaceae bacterium]